MDDHTSEISCTVCRMATVHKPIGFKSMTKRSLKYRFNWPNHMGQDRSSGHSSCNEMRDVMLSMEKKIADHPHGSWQGAQGSEQRKWHFACLQDCRQSSMHFFVCSWVLEHFSRHGWLQCRRFSQGWGRCWVRTTLPSSCFSFSFWHSWQRKRHVFEQHSISRSQRARQE